MKSHFELFSYFCAFFEEIKTLFGVSIRILWSDNDKEYFLESFNPTDSKWYSSSSLLVLRYTSSKRCCGKWKNWYLLEVGRALMFHMKVPKPFWVDVVSIACFHINRMPYLFLMENSILDFVSIKCLISHWSPNFPICSISEHLQAWFFWWSMLITLGSF